MHQVYLLYVTLGKEVVCVCVRERREGVCERGKTTLNVPLICPMSWWYGDKTSPCVGAVGDDVSGGCF